MGDGHGRSVNLPPGFRFSPTDEELVLHFLYRKASCLSCHPDIIPHLDDDQSSFDPWELQGNALSSENQWYFFSKKKANKVTKDGFWKEIDFMEPIFNGGGSDKKVIATKKYLVYYIGHPPNGLETNWIMQEYHLSNFKFPPPHKTNRKSVREKLILCRIYQRKGEYFDYNDDCDDDDGTELSYLDEMYLSLDNDLDDISFPK